MTKAGRRLYTWHGVAAHEWQRRWNVPRLRFYATISSTNTLALRLAAHGAPAGTTIVAEYQTAGRGRRGRKWHAPEGTTLLLSVLTRQGPQGTGGAGPASIRAGLIIANAVAAETGLDARIKWPNDVLAPDGRKIAGILCEGALGGPATWIVVGIGLNVSQQEHEFPAALRGGATSVAAACGRPVDRASMAGRIVRGIATAPDLAAPLAERELDEIAARDALRGHRVSVDDEIVGTAIGIAPDGGLRLDGRLTGRTLYNGTVRRADSTGSAATATHHRNLLPG